MAPALLRSRAAIFTVPPSIIKLPPVAVCNSFPVAVPTFKIPEETLIKPLLLIGNPGPPETLLTVAPFTQIPAALGMLGSDVNWNVPVVALNKPFDMVRFPVFEIAPAPFASTIEVMSEPLLIIMLLNAEAALPLIVLLPGSSKTYIACACIKSSVVCEITIYFK